MSRRIVISETREQLGELADADAALAADLVDDQLLALGGKHRFLGVGDSHNTQR